ncbi:hypothetical protein [Bacillus sp. Marseille-P3661]|uniref:hypothetical protein n=1 Tax=Bacillus sp. Marseille-P3661 TaxID=1936234 RepID=UPI000C850CC1|nr:hypothetical protein [Bacillus sp. Marseille-P3661]
MRKEEAILNGKLTGTIDEKSKTKQVGSQLIADEYNGFGEGLEAIQQTWSVNPVDEEEYDGTIGYKEI